MNPKQYYYDEMEQHTHNHTTDLGRYNLKGQQKPQYLLDANENAELAWESYEGLVDQLTDQDITNDLLDHARKEALDSEQLARDAYIRWQQETCPHTNTFPIVIGEQRMSQGEPDDGTEQIEICAACYAHVPVKDIG